ncbi:MAG: metallophosphoesterase, partial [Kofleriaceae bacterium]
QAAWLDQDLSKTQLPWKIVFMHKPLYSSGDHGVDDKAIKIFAPVFEKHGVQLVLAGHDHHYERMKPQRGVNYMVSGGGGRGTRSAGESDFTAFSEEVIHFLQIEVTSDRLIAHAIDAGGKEFDSLVIER